GRPLRMGGGVSPGASAAPPPRVLPPGVRVRSQGLLLRRYIVLLACQSERASDTLVLPRRHAPAANTLAARGPSLVGRWSLNAGRPADCGRPAVCVDSFSVSGNPRSARHSPRARAAAACRAASRA